MIAHCMSRIATIAGACAVIAACASSSYSYSEIEGRRIHRAPIDTYPVSIVSIDGRANTFRPAMVEPGLRQVTVQGPPGGARGVGEERTIALTVAPCTRYYLVAVKENRLASDFTVRVDHEERVGSCTPPAG